MDYFNLTALIQSGEFRLDSMGLLVARNGTKYTIPSGPPEGRQPLREFRPPLVTPVHPFNKPTQYHQQHDSHVIAKQQRPNPGNPYSGFTNKTNEGMNRYQPILNSNNISQSFSFSNITYKNHTVSDDHLEWGVVLFTLVSASIALVCNMTLSGLLVWKIRQYCSNSKQTIQLRTNDNNDVYYSKPDQRYSKALGVSSINRTTNERVPIVNNYDTSRANPNHRSSYRQRTNRIEPRLSSDDHRRRRRGQNTHRHRDFGSSSDDYWSPDHHKHRRHVTSITTNDSTGNESEDEASRDSSNNNDDDLVFTRRSKQTVVASDYYSDSTTASQEGNYPDDKNYRRIKKQLQAIDSPLSSLSSSTGGNDVLHNDTQCSFAQLACQSIGLHIGLLGCLLTLIQLTAICTSLISSPKRRHSEIICALTCSFAADTILCSRLYLLGAFILALPVLYFCNTRSSLTSQPNSQSQHKAYLALFHSLPWALSAGTALLITFAAVKPSSQTTGGYQSDRLRLNMLFIGLGSLFKCPLSDQQEQSVNNNNNADHSVTNWLPPVSLIFAPLFFLLVIGLVTCVIVIRRRLKRSNLKGARSCLFVLALLISVEIGCHVGAILVDLIWSGNYLIYVKQSIVLTLLISPGLLNLSIRGAVDKIYPLLCETPTFNSSPPNDYVDRTAYRKDRPNLPKSRKYHPTAIVLHKPAANQVKYTEVIQPIKATGGFVASIYEQAPSPPNNIGHQLTNALLSPIPSTSTTDFIDRNSLLLAAANQDTALSARLCPHHRDLLAQHYQPQPRLVDSPNNGRRQMAIDRLELGAMPTRLGVIACNPAPLPPSSQPVTLPTTVTIGCPSTGGNVDHEAVTNSVTNADSGGPGSTATKSPATAAVMAAAAAAVAAQAGTLSPPPTTQLNQTSPSSSN